MQLYSQDMEMRCIVTLTNSKIPETVRSTLLGKLNKEYFHYPPCAAAFNRIDVIARKRFEIVDFSDLMEDPALEEDFRDILRDTDMKSCKNKKAIERMVGQLDEYRKIRIVYDTANSALEKIEGDSVDINGLLDTIADRLTKARRDINEEDQFVVIGKNNNADDLVHNVLNKVVDQMIKTGFTKYDTRNGGLPDEGVMIIAATTSGGKSTVLMNLLVNLYLESNKRVGRISLEMGDEQEMQRMLSRLSKVPFWKIKQQKLSPKEKQRIKKAYDKFKQHGEDNDCVFTSVSPTRGIRIDEALRIVKPYGLDVVGIDYVSLLEGVDEDNQWRILSSIVREAKVFSRENKCLVIILCQLDADTDKIRYSRGMKEHADVMWSWNYSKKEQREIRILPINVDKARDGELFTFELGERFDIMMAENIEGDSGYGDDDDESGDDIDLNAEDDSEAAEDEDDYALS
tara:strand:+ start:12075 stop:13448 length:1374 start_codon:yes stop_codon:yes gene_type:complete